MSAALRIAALVLLLVLSATSLLRAEGALSRLRGDARAPRSADEQRRRDERRREKDDDDCDHDEDSGFIAGLLSSLFDDDDDDCDDSSSASLNDDDGDDAAGAGLFVFAVAGATSPWWVPVSLTGDDYELASYDLPFPYEGDEPGYLTTDPDKYYFPQWSLRTYTEYGSNLDDLSFISTRALIETYWRFGIDSEFRYWQEHSLVGGNDQLWTGDTNFVFRFARSDRLQMRTGAGFNWLSDVEGSDFGFNFTYGGDWFPHQPWIVSADIDWGTIANTELFHARTTVGVSLLQFEAFTGYDYFDATAFRTHGLVGGVRFWF